MRPQNIYDVILVGGGASGSLCALLLSEPERLAKLCSFKVSSDSPQNFLRILLLEGQAEVGRKILATGNGRCNLAPTEQALTAYHSLDSDRLPPYFQKWSPEQTCALFSSLGVPTRVEENRIYPYSNRARSVQFALQRALQKSCVTIQYGVRVTRIDVAQPSGEAPLYTVESEGQNWKGKYVVLATGGWVQPSAPELAGSIERIPVLGELLPLVPPRPALTAFAFKHPLPRLAGVRTEAAIELWERSVHPDEGRCLYREEGEIQFTKYGLSGIPLLNASHAYLDSPSFLKIDLLPYLQESELVERIQIQQRQFPDLLASQWAIDILHEALSDALLFSVLTFTQSMEEGPADRFNRRKPQHKGSNPSAHWRENRQKPSRNYNSPADLKTLLLSELTPAQIRSMAHRTKNWVHPIEGLRDYTQAQISRGGLPLSALVPASFALAKHPQLYAIGELLDVDGICGGYNLQWAWLSAVGAAQEILQKEGKLHDS